MKKTNCLFIAVVSLVIGCAHTHRLEQRPLPAYFDEINKTAQGRKGQIALKSGQVFEGRNLLVAADSASWFDAKTGNNQSVATSEINAIMIKSSGKRSGEGLGIGILSGFASGFLLVMSKADPCEGCNREGLAVIVGGIFAVPGGLIGGLTGAAIGSTDKFIMPNATEPSSNK
ncbi:MAG: hypothetical protein ACRENG_37885 [bacterium]